MNNSLKSKTRLTFIQIIFENISTKKDILEILDNFNLNYKSTYIQNFNDKKKIKFEFNSKFLEKLINYYQYYIKNTDYIKTINNLIDFRREYKKWDIINKSILLAALSELQNTNSLKIKIVLNDYLSVGKSFIDNRDVGMINAIIDKIINEKK